MSSRKIKEFGAHMSGEEDWLADGEEDRGETRKRRQWELLAVLSISASAPPAPLFSLLYLFSLLFFKPEECYTSAVWWKCVCVCFVCVRLMWASVCVFIVYLSLCCVCLLFRECGRGDLVWVFVLRCVCVCLCVTEMVCSQCHHFFTSHSSLPHAYFMELVIYVASRNQCSAEPVRCVFVSLWILTENHWIITIIFFLLKISLNVMLLSTCCTCDWASSCCRSCLRLADVFL